MSENVITVDSLSKSYWLSHQLQGGRGKIGQYERLSEVLTRALTAPFRRAKVDQETGRSEEFWALKDISFEVKRGEVIGIIGRNGAGKSTLLKVLSRITEPTSGRIEIDGRVASLLEVGTGFHPELTGRENVFLNGAILGMTRVEIKRKFDEIVAFAEVEKFLDTPVKRYSSGMYVRLAFAVAAHLEPEILIVDEVLAVGDVQFQKKCLGKMREVSRDDGRTVLFVSHNTAAISQLTQRCLLLQRGKVAFVGETDLAVEHYMQAGAESAGTTFDVEQIPRKWLGNMAAKILRLRFERLAAQFSAEEDFGFTTTIRVDRLIERLRASVTIFSQDGTPVGSSFSADSESTWRAGQILEIAAVLPCPRLAPGRYYCSVGIGKGDPRTGHTEYDVVSDTLNFEVIPTAGDAGTLSIWTPVWGRVMFEDTRIAISPPR